MAKRLWRGQVEVRNEFLNKKIEVQGNYYMSINPQGAGACWCRKTAQEIYSPLLLAFTHENSESWTTSHLMKSSSMEPNYSLPLNVAVITLQAGEDVEYSTMSKVEPRKMFSTGKKIKEMSLSTNQEKSEMTKKTWKVEDDSGEEPTPLKGGPVDNSTLVVELGPMEIRTFLLKFEGVFV